MRQAGQAFLDADVNGDQQLDWDEFYLVIPEDMKSKTPKDQLKKLFEEADADGSGFVTIDEYFLWALNVAKEQSSMGLVSIFQRYDLDNTGTLDAEEFKRACTDINFGDYAHDIFLELDEDGSGTVSYNEVMEKLMHCKGSFNSDSKKFLTSLAFHTKAFKRTGGIKELAAEVDLTGWKLTGSDMRSLRKSLGNHLLVHSMRVSDFCNLISRMNGDDALTRSKFPFTFRMLGFDGDDEVLRHIFTALDANGNGKIGTKELYAWMSGTVGRQQLALEVTLLTGREDLLTLDAIHWSCEELQRQMQLMLLWNNLSPLDLLTAWDSSQDGSFSFKEFLRMCKKLVKPGKTYQNLWDEEIRPVVQETFYEVGGQDKTLDVTEFERFLNRGWLDSKKRMIRQRAGHVPSDDVLSSVKHLRRAKSWRRQSMATKAAEDAKTAEEPVVATEAPRPERALKATREAPDRPAGWEVRAYLTRVAMMAELPRRAGERWRLLDEAKQQLRERQHPSAEECWWALP